MGGGGGCVESDSEYSFTGSETTFDQRRPAALRIQTGSKVTLHFDCNYLGKGFIDLRNPSTENVAFKVRTTAPSSYLVRPSLGVIPPRAQRRIRLEYVHSEPLDEAARRDPHEYLPLISKDKFMIQSMVVDGFEYPSRDIWTDHSGDIRSQVLTVEYFYRRDMVHERRQSTASRYTSHSSFDCGSSAAHHSHRYPSSYGVSASALGTDRQETISTEASIQRQRFRKSLTVSAGAIPVTPLNLEADGRSSRRPPINIIGRMPHQQSISHRPSAIPELPSKLLASGGDESSCGPVTNPKDSLLTNDDTRLGTFELTSGTDSSPGSCVLSSVAEAGRVAPMDQGPLFATPGSGECEDSDSEVGESGNVSPIDEYDEDEDDLEGGTESVCSPAPAPGACISGRKVLRRLTEPYPLSGRVLEPDEMGRKVLERDSRAQTSTTIVGGEDGGGGGTAAATPRSYSSLRTEFKLLRGALQSRDEQIELLQDLLDSKMRAGGGSAGGSQVNGGMSSRAGIVDKAIQCSLGGRKALNTSAAAVGGGGSGRGPSQRSSSSIIAGLILLVMFGGLAFLGLRGGLQLEQLL